MTVEEFKPERPYRRIAQVLAALGVIILVGDVFAIRTALVQAVDIPTSVIITICGDGLVGDTELCDAGSINNTGVYASSTGARICAADCISFGPYCGDGVLQVRFLEQCDDGNNTNGDLCSATCMSETAVPPGSSGSPTVGSTPQIPGASPGQIPSITATRVVLRGKAYPNSEIRILLDGKELGTTLADANADFLYSTIQVSPGVSSFGFLASDVNGIPSITTTAIFDVVQSAVTTVSNIFLPPTISVSKSQVAPGDLVTIRGQSIPNAKIKADIMAASTTKTTLTADADLNGLWAIQVDTQSLKEGSNTSKAMFEITSALRSGYGRSVNFVVGDAPSFSLADPDMNDDGKVNLVDFSIFLLSWNTTEAKADFNGDKAVNLADFSIMLFAWTG